MEYLTELGYLGMFVSAFLAATILPLSSEIVLSALLLNDFNPSLIITIATLGNVIGSVINYAIGYWLNGSVIKKALKISDEHLIQAEKRFQKYGLASLCLAWVPIIGDPLTVVAGMLRVNLMYFLTLVTLGKLLRYVLLSHFVLQTA